jgi:beta-aspartyl-peptidase (threonine type)
MRVDMTPAIIVHGGAGAIEDARRDGCVAGVERAAGAGWAVLESGGSALDAVEAAVRVLEDDEEFNAGYGSVLSSTGAVETDAGIMDGALRAGAVGALPRVKNPVSVARRLLELGQHVLLVGDGALAFVIESGLPTVAPEALISPRARARHEAALRGEREKMFSAANPVGDTVGACAIDAMGHVAAATSTGGIVHKRPGRVGDSPILGAGLHADDRAGAASATGQGEAIMRIVLCKNVTDLLQGGASPDEAACAAVRQMVERTGGHGGVIVISADGRVGHFASTPRMPWASVVGGVRQSGAEHA